MRQTAMGACKSSQKIPSGKALMNALKSEAHKWQKLREMLVPHPHQRGPSWMERMPVFVSKGDGHKGGNTGANDGSPKGAYVGGNVAKADGKGNIKWEMKNGEGKMYCTQFNQKGCSRQDCSALHVCNAVMPSGKVCSSVQHDRAQHNAARDGDACIFLTKAGAAGFMHAVGRT